MSHNLPALTVDEKASLTNSPSAPTGANPVATQADLTGTLTDEQVKVSADDTTTGYLLSKVVGTASKITATETTPGGNETLVINIGTDVFDKAVDDTDDITEGATNLFNQTHTGDVTGSVALTIATDVVDNTNLANMAANTMKGNDTGGAADPKDLTVAEVLTLLGIGTPKFAIRGVAATGNILTSDFTVVVDSSGGVRTMTLPTAASTYSAPNGQVFNVKREGGSNVTVDVASAGTIDGSTTFVLTADDQSVQLQSNGTEYKVI